MLNFFLSMDKDYKKAMRWYKLGHQRSSASVPNNTGGTARFLKLYDDEEEFRL